MLTDEQKRIALELRAQGLGYKRIARRMNVKPAQVGDYIRNISRGNHPVKMPSPSIRRARAREPNGAQNTIPPTPREPLDWEGKLDEVGRVAIALISRAIQEGRERDAQAWIDRFVRMAQAKAGAMQINVDARRQTVEITADKCALMEKLKKYEEMLT